MVSKKKFKFFSPHQYAVSGDDDDDGEWSQCQWKLLLKSVKLLKIVNNTNILV